ncbi:hypothetical protein GQX73_g7441 [Xylaria multiplex]|uniref:Nucleoside phosphorylase domain-containing protein n=1 Tax=Xylaria multiplex TaxID=323545 RepID=A0A7C8IKZ9_9PEZI|nr:hypothetical protein GQX73_g7441 [Xylaria multiplex]
MATSTRKTRDDYTIAILCALSFERDAVRFMLDKEHTTQEEQGGDSNSYRFGELHGHNVVLVCLPGKEGNCSAATVATNMSRSFPSIKWRLFVGIGGGVPDKHDIRLGDVVISIPDGEYPGVVQWNLGRETGSKFEPKGFLWPIPARLRNAAQDMKSDCRFQDNRVEEYMRTMSQDPRMDSYKRPLEPDLLFDKAVEHNPGCTGNNPDCTEDDPGCDSSKAEKRLERSSEGPVIHYGLIASGDCVIKSGKKRFEYSKRFNRDVLCFEMAAAGLMTEHPSIVIRGISDYADSHKNKNWQNYAAATAAACAKELLSKISSEALVDKPTPTAMDWTTPTAGRNTQWGNTFIGQGVQNMGSFSVGGNYNVHK